VARRVCSEPGCPKLTDAGRCLDCTRQADTRRGTATERGYNGKGHRNRFRPAVLARNPICVLCRAARATVADHYPLSRRDLLEQGLDPDDPTYGRGLCTPCHGIETTRHQPGGWHATQ
jgi:5-methylcytosine-specific restriction protein A